MTLTPHMLEIFKKEINKNYNQRISEPDFRNKYLPLFLFPTESGQNMMVWVQEVAKSYVIGVDVYDPITKEVLFTTPPVIDTRGNLNTNKNIMPIEGASKNYGDMIQVYPQDAKRILKNSLQAHITNVIPSDTEEAYSAQWIAMLDYYEIPRKSSAATKAAAAASDDGVFDIDEGKF